MSSAPEVLARRVLGVVLNDPLASTCPFDVPDDPALIEEALAILRRQGLPGVATERAVTILTATLTTQV